MATMTEPSVEEIRAISQELGIEFYFAQFVDMYARPSAKLVPAANLDDLVTGEYRLADTEQALAAGRDPHSVKAVVRPALSDTHDAKGEKSELHAAG